MLYLKIENKGEAPVEGYLLLGVSTTRESKDKRTIGQFGSGSKHAVSLMLRHDINPTVFCGSLRLDFFAKPITVDDGIAEFDYSRVCAKLSGKKDGKSVRREEDLGFVLEHGVYDWTDLSMALREMVSNAIDRTIREGGEVDDVVIEIVDSIRAKAGHTRVFVPLTPDVQRFYRELPKRFLHFKESDNLEISVLSKANREFEDKKCAMLYKKGVFVRESANVNSLFDYNFGDELLLDESRNVDEYRVKQSAANEISKSSCVNLAIAFQSVARGEDTFESNFDDYHLTRIYDDNDENRKETWQKAWKAAFGDAIMCRNHNELLNDLVKKKGFKAVVMDNSSWFDACRYHGIKSNMDILTIVEKDGNKIIPATEDVILATEEVWGWLEGLGVLNGRDKPEVHCYQDIMSAGSKVLGYYSDDKVYINHDISVGFSELLMTTVLEELAHHITGATDMSRDFQDFAFTVAMRSKSNPISY